MLVTRGRDIAIVAVLVVACLVFARSQAFDTGGGVITDVALWQTTNFSLIKNPTKALELLNETADNWPNLNLIYTRWQSATSQRISIRIPIDSGKIEKVLVAVLNRVNPAILQSIGVEYWPIIVSLSTDLDNVAQVKTATFKIADDLLWKIYTITTPIGGDLRLNRNPAQVLDPSSQTYIEVYAAGVNLVTTTTTTTLLTTTAAPETTTQPGSTTAEFETTTRWQTTTKPDEPVSTLLPPVTDLMDPDFAMSELLRNLFALLGNNTFSTLPSPALATTTFSVVASTTRRSTTLPPTTTTPPWSTWVWQPPTWATGWFETTTPRYGAATLPVVYVNHPPNRRLGNNIWPPFVPAVNLPSHLQPIRNPNVVSRPTYPHRPLWTRSPSAFPLSNSIFFEEYYNQARRRQPLLLPSNPYMYSHYHHPGYKYFEALNPRSLSRNERRIHTFLDSEAARDGQGQYRAAGSQSGMLTRELIFHPAVAKANVRRQQQFTKGGAQREVFLAKLRIASLAILAGGVISIIATLLVIAHVVQLSLAEVIDELWEIAIDMGELCESSTKSKIRLGLAGSIITLSLFAVCFSTAVVISISKKSAIWPSDKQSIVGISACTLALGTISYVTTHGLIIVKKMTSPKKS